MWGVFLCLNTTIRILDLSKLMTKILIVEDDNDINKLLSEIVKTSLLSFKISLFRNRGFNLFKRRTVGFNLPGLNVTRFIW